MTQVLSQMRNGKAAENDVITADLLKIDIDVTRRLTLIQKIWEEETFPNNWKIPKKGDTQKCENLRGISLLNVTSKVFNRIKDILEDTIQKEQSRF